MTNYYIAKAPCCQETLHTVLAYGSESRLSFDSKLELKVTTIVAEFEATLPDRRSRNVLLRF